MKDENILNLKAKIAFIESIVSIMLLFADDLVNEWVSERVNEWMSEWMKNE